MSILELQETRYGKPSLDAKTRLDEALRFIPEHHQQLLAKEDTRYMALSFGEDLIESGIFDLHVDPKQKTFLAGEIEKTIRTTIEDLRRKHDIPGNLEQIEAQLILKAFKSYASKVSVQRPGKLSDLTEQMAGFKKGTDLYFWFLNEAKRLNAQYFSKIKENHLWTITLNPGETYFFPVHRLVHRKETPVLISNQTIKQNVDWGKVFLDGPEIGGFHDGLLNIVVFRKEVTPVEAYCQTHTAVHESGHALHQILFNKIPDIEKTLFQASVEASRKIQRGEGLAQVFNNTCIQYILRSSPVENIAITYEWIHSQNGSRISAAIAHADPAFWEAFQLLENFGK